MVGMRIVCPFCGERELSEFAYHGDAGAGRPNPDVPEAQTRFFEAVYLRENPMGRHAELWYHAFGCRSIVRVTRDTRTHVIHDVELLKQVVHS